MLEHYQTLGLQENASTEEIEKAYRHLIAQWAPNKHHRNAQATTQAIGKTLAIMAAYQAIKPQTLAPITIKTYQDIVSREDDSANILSLNHADLLESLKSNFHLILKIWDTNYRDKLILASRLHAHGLLKPLLLDDSKNIDHLTILLSQIGHDRSYRDQLYHLILSINEDSLLRRMFCFFVTHNEQDRITDMLMSCPSIASSGAINVALSIAVSLEHHHLTTYLLTLGADPNIPMPSGATLLHHAAFHGNKTLCEQLLANGAHVNAADRHGQTPLYLAVSKRYKEVAELLLAQDADMEYPTKTGMTAAKLAMQNKALHQLLLLKPNRQENTSLTLPQTTIQQCIKPH